MIEPVTIEKEKEEANMDILTEEKIPNVDTIETGEDNNIAVDNKYSSGE